MSLGTFLVGAAFFLSTLAASLIAARLIVVRRLDYLRGPGRLLAFALLAVSALLFAQVAPAALGILDRPAVLVCALLFLGAAAAIPQRHDLADTRPPQPPPSGLPSRVIAVLAVAAAVIYELSRVRGLIAQPLMFIDVLGFHMPGVARWIQTGTLWRVDQFAPGFATAQYPNNGDFLNLATVLPWHDMAFVRFGMGLFYLLTGCGTYALALELRARRAAAATFAAAVMTVPAVSNFAFEGLPDAVTLSMLAIGLVFLVRYERFRLGSDLVLGALGLGLSFGAKWYGVTSVVVVVAVWAAAWLLVARRELAATLRDTAKIAAMIALGGGIWIVRNVIESGNPLYPKAVSLLGVQLFAGSHKDVVDRYGYSVASYLGQPTVLRKYIWPGFKLEVGLVGIVIVAGLIVAAVGSIRALRKARLADAGAAPLLAVAVATVGICGIYLITPGTAYGPQGLPLAGYQTIRWLMPAAVAGAAVAAASIRYLGGAGVLFELGGLAGVVDGIRLGEAVPHATELRVAVVLALIAAATALLRRRVTTMRRRLASLTPALAAALGLLLVVGAAGLLRLQQTSFDRHDYAPFDPVFAWIDAHAASGHRIGVTGAVTLDGLVPMLPSMGPRLGNYAGFVGDPVVHSVEEPSSLNAFRSELRQGRYDLLEIGLANTSHTDAWARALGFRLLVQSRRLALYAAPAGGHFS